MEGKTGDWTERWEAARRFDAGGRLGPLAWGTDRWAAGQGGVSVRSPKGEGSTLPCTTTFFTLSGYLNSLVARRSCAVICRCYTGILR